MVFGCTPDYMMLEKTKRDQIRIRAEQRAMQYEERIRNAMSITILKEWLKEKEKEKEKEATKTRNTQERREYLTRNGYS